MRAFAKVTASILLVSACSGAEERTDEEMSSNGTTAAAGPADYDIPESKPGLFWFYAEGDGAPAAIYGPPESTGDVALSCLDNSVEVSLIGMGGPSGYETATVKSGPISADFTTTFDDSGMDVLYFSIPVDNPILKRFARDGFFVSFPNKESDGVPPGGKIDLALKNCVE